MNERYFLVGIIIHSKYGVAGGKIIRLIYDKFPSEEMIKNDESLNKLKELRFDIVSITETNREDYINFRQEFKTE